ncbi:MAG: hypothetical protein HYR85_11755 [Planctomycetes bacterium]|nr:hypothetical protein [Planctomycetota bacterium]MBI3843959.1 hypothetical protein [Planctomycetota bacterium]
MEKTKVPLVVCIGLVMSAFARGEDADVAAAKAKLHSKSAFGHGKVLHLISHLTFRRDGVRGVGKDAERLVFAADWMGIDLRELRRLREAGFFETKQYKDDERRPKVTETWSMFRVLTNLLREKKSRDR